MIFNNHFLGIEWTIVLKKLGDKWKEHANAQFNQKSRRIEAWLTDHPSSIDEAIDSDLWLDHDAGNDKCLLEYKYHSNFCFLFV